MAASLSAVAALLTTACLGTVGGTPATRLHPCAADDGPAGAYCGTLTVFENRRAQSGRRIDLAIVVLPAASDDHAPDPLFFLAGGPGQGAARMASLVRGVFNRVERRRDIVLVDQRGTGRSHPLDCPPDPDSLAAAVSADDQAIARLRTCLADLDADVRLYTTDIAMDDLDDVRAYLGYDLVNLYGGSYGTRAALVYLRQHGGHVRSVVLDGAAPTDMRLPLFAARDAERVLQRVLHRCANDAPCASAFPNLRSRVAMLLQRLDRTPARVTLVHPRTGIPETVDVDARVVASAIFGALYSPVTASTLPLLLDRAANGDLQGLIAMAFAGDASENVSVGMQLSVLCSEDAPHVTHDDVIRETGGLMFGVHLLEGQLRACQVWPHAQMAAGYDLPVGSDVPALVLSGDADPVTPPSWGRAVAAHLSRSRHLIAPATGHGVAGTACGARVIADFVDAGRADDVDASCLKALTAPPFFLTPSGPDPGALRRASR